MTQSRLHRKILDRLELGKVCKTSVNSGRDEILVIIRSEVNTEVVPHSFSERERLAREILHELFRGPEDGDATGIAINKPRTPTGIEAPRLRVWIKNSISLLVSRSQKAN